jgi:hypothetical protein
MNNAQNMKRKPSSIAPQKTPNPKGRQQERKKQA